MYRFFSGFDSGRNLFVVTKDKTAYFFVIALSLFFLPQHLVNAAAVEIPPEQWFNALDRSGYPSKTYDSESPPIEEVLPTWIAEYHWPDQDSYYDLPEVIGSGNWAKANPQWTFHRGVNLKQRVRNYFKGNYSESYIYPNTGNNHWYTCRTDYRFKENWSAWQNGQPGPTCILVDKQPNCPPLEGNPCNPITGNKFETAIDVPATGIHGPEFKRSYASIRTHSGLLGAKWRSPFENNLRLLVGNGITSVQATRPDGWVLHFTQLNGVWTPDSDIADRLTQTASGWVYSMPDGNSETYDANGRLLGLTNRQGLTQTLTYDVGGKLISVTGPSGHSLAFFW